MKPSIQPSELDHSSVYPDIPFERIVFDCDSTLSLIEGIDELAGSQKEAIASLTRDAMEGRTRLEDVYGERLRLIAPNRNLVATVGRHYIEQATPHARDVIAALKSLGKDVQIISGGLRLAVVTFAGWLGLRDDQVHAVKIYFDSDSHYRSYDKDSPLTRDDGKPKVLAGLPPARTAFVGDGMTDAGTRGVADLFICFCGVTAREEVAARADAVVRTPSLAGILPIVCTPAELDILRRDPRIEYLMAHAYE